MRTIQLTEQDADSLLNALRYVRATVGRGGRYPLSNENIPKDWALVHRGRSEVAFHMASKWIEILSKAQSTSDLGGNGEAQEVLDDLGKCSKIALKLEVMNPEIPGAFTGTPSQRIKRQLEALGILEKDDETI